MVFATELITNTELATLRTNVRTRAARPVDLAPKVMECAVCSPLDVEIPSAKTALISRATELALVLAILKFANAIATFAKCV